MLLRKYLRISLMVGEYFEINGETKCTLLPNWSIWVQSPKISRLEPGLFYVGQACIRPLQVPGGRDFKITSPVTYTILGPVFRRLYEPHGSKVAAGFWLGREYFDRDGVVMDANGHVTRCPKLMQVGAVTRWAAGNVTYLGDGMYWILKRRTDDVYESVDNGHATGRVG